MHTVTFNPERGESITVPMDKDPKIARECDEKMRYINDVSLSIDIHPAFPLQLVFLLRADGRLDFWYSQFSYDYNGYLHFGPNDDHSRLKPCTEAQRKKLAELYLKINLPFENMHMHPGAPVMEWADITNEYIEQIASAGGINIPAIC